MIGPNEVAARAEQKEDENYAFRTYLKNHANPEELDAQFLKQKVGHPLSCPDILITQRKGVII